MILHWEADLLHTREHGIRYRRERITIEGFIHDVLGYTDSDFTGYSNDRKSTSGWVFMFNGASISWSLWKQGLITCSSMEAELVAGSITSTEAIWIIKLGKDFQHDFIPLPLYINHWVDLCAKRLRTWGEFNHMVPWFSSWKLVK